MQSIDEHLDILRSKTLADRAYVVVYSYGFSQYGEGIKMVISNTFEVCWEGITPQISDFQGSPRETWLQAKENQQRNDGFIPVFPQSHGIELYNEHKTAIGYIGVEYLQKRPTFQEHEMNLLQQAAESIKAAFSQPVEHLDTLE